MKTTSEQLPASAPPAPATALELKDVCNSFHTGEGRPAAGNVPGPGPGLRLGPREAENFEHAISGFMAKRLDAFPGHPDRDPHGDLIRAPTGPLHIPRCC